jgi:hypothetical protein
MDIIAPKEEKTEPMLHPGEPIGVCPLGHDWRLWRPRPEIVRDARITAHALVWLESRGLVHVTGVAA